jgi:hypothetical protein
MTLGMTGLWAICGGNLVHRAEFSGIKSPLFNWGILLPLQSRHANEALYTYWG